MATPPDDDGFTSVTYKKPQQQRAAKNRRGKNRFRERTLEEKLQSREAELRRTGYLQQCRELLRNAFGAREADDSGPDDVYPCPAPTCVVCLGLGSIADSTKAQDQYIMLRELLEEMRNELDPEIQTEFYDPVFSPEDAEYLRTQGHQVLPANHPLRLDRRTLLYVPHGPRPLFEALLAANWTSADQISRLVLLGNRFDLYDDPTYSGSLRDRRNGVDGEGDELGEKAELLARASGLFHIAPLPDTKDHLEAFNDLALQWVPSARAAQQPPNFWLEAPSAAASDERQQDEEEKRPSEDASAVDAAVERLSGLSLKP